MKQHTACGIRTNISQVFDGHHDFASMQRILNAQYVRQILGFQCQQHCAVYSSISEAVLVPEQRVVTHTRSSTSRRWLGMGRTAGVTNARAMITPGQSSNHADCHPVSRPGPLHLAQMACALQQRSLRAPHPLPSAAGRGQFSSARFACPPGSCTQAVLPR